MIYETLIVAFYYRKFRAECNRLGPAPLRKDWQSRSTFTIMFLPSFGSSSADASENSRRRIAIAINSGSAPENASAARKPLLFFGKISKTGIGQGDA